MTTATVVVVPDFPLSGTKEGREEGHGQEPRRRQEGRSRSQEEGSCEHRKQCRILSVTTSSRVCATRAPPCCSLCASSSPGPRKFLSSSESLAEQPLLCDFCVLAAAPAHPNQLVPFHRNHSFLLPSWVDCHQASCVDRHSLLLWCLQKWSKGKVREKLNNLVVFDQATYDRMLAEVKNFKLVTPSAISERLKVFSAST